MAFDVKHLWNGLNRPDNQLLLLITPSLLSGSIASLAAIVIVVATAIAIGLPGSAIWELMQQTRAGSPPPSSGPSTVDNSFIGNLPLMIFWGGVGVIVYGFVSTLAKIFRNAEEFMERMNYVNVDRRQMINYALLKLGLRIGVLLMWVWYVRLTISTLLPYGLAAVQVAVKTIEPAEQVVYVCLAFVVLAVTFHLHVIFARLLRLRPRLFGQA